MSRHIFCRLPGIMSRAMQFYCGNTQIAYAADSQAFGIRYTWTDDYMHNAGSHRSDGGDPDPETATCEICASVYKTHGVLTLRPDINMEETRD